jgi:hypothetical protein
MQIKKIRTILYKQNKRNETYVLCLREERKWGGGERSPPEPHRLSSVITSVTFGKISMHYFKHRCERWCLIAVEAHTA